MRPPWAGSVADVAPSALHGSTRLARAFVFGSSGVVLAAGAHVAGGGSLPPPPVLALLVVPVSWVSVALSGRQRGPVMIGACLWGTQALLHEAFMGLSASASGCSSAGGAVHTMPGMPGIAPAGLWRCSASAAAMPANGLTDRVMLLAHVVACVLTGMMLARGETLAGSIAALLAHATRVSRALTALVVRVPPPFLTGPAVAVRPGRTLQDGTRRRGPPVFAAAAVAMA